MAKKYDKPVLTFVHIIERENFINSLHNESIIQT